MRNAADPLTRESCQDRVDLLFDRVVGRRLSLSFCVGLLLSVLLVRDAYCNVIMC